MTNFFEKLPLEDRLAALGTSVFVLLGLVFGALQYQQNTSQTTDISAQLGEQISRQLASQIRYDVFNSDALSMAAVFNETISAPTISRAAIISVDGEIIAAADKDLPFDVESPAYRQEIATEDSIIGYAEVVLDHTPQIALQRRQIMVQAVLLFASSLLCFLIFKLMSSRVSQWLREVGLRLDQQQPAPDYPHNDALGELLTQLFGAKQEDGDDVTLTGQTVIAIRVHEWSQLNRQLDRALLEQIARELEYIVSDVADRLILQWEHAAGGFDIHLSPQEFDVASATDTMVAASLLLRLHRHVAQQRMREGKVDFSITVGIGELIPPNINIQRRQPTLTAQLPALAKQQAHYLASMAEENSISVSERFVEAWSLASTLADARPAERTRAALSCSGLLPPYDDIVEQHLQAILKIRR